MIKKKNAFLTFCFSLLPGAGQMYMGFMKRGISLMASFFLVIFLSVWLNIGPLLFVVPIVWFFAFFDTHNLRSMSDEEFRSFKDDYIIIPEFAKDWTHTAIKHRTIIAIALIALGFTLLWNNLYDILASILPNYLSLILYRIGRTFPQMLIGIAIITLGIILISGKKKELDADQSKNQPQDKGEFTDGQNS